MGTRSSRCVGHGKRLVVSDMAQDETVDLGADISDLWCDEGCSWHVDYDAGAGSASPWLVVLEWVQEGGLPYHRDVEWVTWTWQFYGDTVDEALGDAAEWCWALVPWRRCEACDGAGEYGMKGGKVRCDECDGSGLAERSL